MLRTFRQMPQGVKTSVKTVGIFAYRRHLVTLFCDPRLRGLVTLTLTVETPRNLSMRLCHPYLPR